MDAPTLDAFLESRQRNGHDADVLSTVRALASAALKVGSFIRSGAPESAFSDVHGPLNGDVHPQRDLHRHAGDLFLEAARRAPVRCMASSERAEPILLDPVARTALAICAQDDSSNIDLNLSTGTIFSLLPATGGPDTDPAAFFLQSGGRQVAAGFFMYGPQLALVLTLGKGTHAFAFSQRMGTFVQIHDGLNIDQRTREFAIDASNYRHWDEAVRLYVDDCLKGEEGPRGKNFDMRWIGSPVAETYRILVRGGVFLYPGDRRKGHGCGRLRLVCEANPIALLIEQAGGSATDAVSRILDLCPESLHQRVPLVFGSAREVERIGRYHSEPAAIAERSPLFGHRGLFRA
jgi:fructose-1,6-bisphosphatase I